MLFYLISYNKASWNVRTCLQSYVACTVKISEQNLSKMKHLKTGTAAFIAVKSHS